MQPGGGQILDDLFAATRSWGWLGALVACSPSQCVDMRGKAPAQERHPGLVHLGHAVQMLHQKRQAALAGQTAVAGGELARALGGQGHGGVRCRG